MIIVFQPPCGVQVHQPPDQAAQSHIQRGLECLQGWGILRQPVPVCHHLLCEKLLPNIQPKPPLSQFKTIPLCPLITIHPCKQPLPFLFTRSLQALEGHNEVSPEPSLLQAKQAQFPQPFLIGELPGYTTLLPPSMHFPLFSQFELQVLALPRRSPASPAELLLLGDGEPLHSQKGVLKELPALFCTHALKDSFPGDPTQQFLERRKFALLKHRVLALLLAKPAFFKITNSTKAWSLQPRLPPILMSLMLSSSLLSTRSSKASPQFGPSITWTRKLS